MEKRCGMWAALAGFWPDEGVGGLVPQAALLRPGS